MRKILRYSFILILALASVACVHKVHVAKDMQALAESRKGDLQISVYVIAQTINEYFTTEEGRREVLSILHCNGITRVYVEAYRSGLVIPPALLKSSVEFLKENGFEVIGGIATVPGKDFGVAQEAKLGWLNWQNPKTQNDIRKVMEDSAPFFDQFIVDDFFCTADTSLESKAAKGDRSWSEYRRSLLTELAQSVFIKPAKAKNPAIKIIIKYPQWYDRFHLFGYDVATEPAMFDGVWVGTETRGQYTQRLGFIQPYLGFINYRWLATLSGPKIGGSWFDHIDCTDLDFIDQAYQSVLAGSKEIVLFNLDNFLSSHPGHHLLRQDFEKLANLAKTVAQHPVVGAVGYKPANSDAKGDLYIMDYIGMFGTSLVPDSKYPENSPVVFLPAQAATDPDILVKIKKSLANGAKLVFTTGFIASAKDGQAIADLAGIKWPIEAASSSSNTLLEAGISQPLKFALVTDYLVVPTKAKTVLEISKNNPFMVQLNNCIVLNTHTFSQQDFDAVGEVLLAPRQIGLIEFPQGWVNAIRSAFQIKGNPILNAPSRVTFQQLADQSFIVHNYNQEITSVEIELSKSGEYLDAFSGKTVPTSGTHLTLNMAARSRIWIKPKNQ